MIRLNEPYLFGNEKKFLLDCINSNWVASNGKYVEKFEEFIKKYIRTKYAQSCINGTSALHLALKIIGVKKNDEVVLPAQTFLASAMAIKMVGAKPVFADIDFDTGNISIDSIIDKISSKTKAIMPVHYGGNPCKLKEINNIARVNKLFVIEDAAQAFGAEYNNKIIGNISDFTIFSFQATKNLTTGDGGLICSKNKKNYFETQKKRWFGINRRNSKISFLGERIFDLKDIGYKYHMNDIAAAIGIGNLLNYKKNLKLKRQIANHYYKNLNNIDGINFLKIEKNSKSAYWLFPLLVNDRKNFIKKLRSHNIPVSVVNSGVDKFSIFGGVQNNLVNQRSFDKHQVCLPIHCSLSKHDLKKICDTILSGW
tara:strand:- start:9 stop:1112 length:1104 start_codon:yes stop_codon:yes gene_type:complete